MAEPDLPLITERAVRAAVTAASFERGKQYYRTGRVARLEWHPTENKIEAAVIGSGRRPYTTKVWLGGDPVGSTVRMNACSCPLGGDCKHVVASLLSLQARAGRPPTGSMRTGVTPTAATPPPVWKSALGPLLRGGDPGATGHDVDRKRLGLQFRVDGLKQALDLAPHTVRATPTRLQVRPVQQSGTGAWSGGYAVGWNPGRYGRTAFDARAAAWLEELGSLWHQAGYSYGYSSAEWRTLDEFAPAAVWSVLAAAAEVDVPLVGNAKRDEVELATRADLTLEVSAAAGGGVTLRRRVSFDDAEDTWDVCGAVGAGGLFGVRLDGKARRLVVGPTPQRLTEAERALLTFPGTSVPAADVTEFLEATAPRLRRQVRLRSSDHSVQLPDPPVPRLVLTITVPTPGGLRLAWQWLYGTVRRPLHAIDPLRDVVAEVVVLRRVESSVGDGLTVVEHVDLAGSAAITFVQTVLPVLKDSADVVVEDDELPAYREIEDAPLITVAAREGADPDWFDLGIEISVEGREVPFMEVFQALARDEEFVLLADGSYLRTDLPALHKLRTLIEEARRLQDRPGPLRLNRYAAGLWGDLAELADVVEQSERWRASVGALAALSADHAVPSPVALPDGLRAELRPYQKEAYDWLAFLHQHGLGGILADDMGLGKTVEVLALLEHLRAAGAGDRSVQRPPFLVVAPASVIANWGLEAARFTPELRTLVLPSTSARLGVPIAEAAADVDLVVTSYAIFRLDFEQLSSVAWAGLIMDEAQFLKNPKTRANECARLLRAPFKLAVTGTPLENNLIELWAMLAVVAPGLYGSGTRFREDYVKVVADGLRARQSLAQDAAGHLQDYDDEDRGEDSAAARAGELALARLRRRVRPLLLRRTKEQVAPDLPDRIEQELRVELAPKHRHAYDLLLQRERQRVLRLLEDDFDGNRFTIFRSLTLLRRAALDISLTDPDRYAKVPSAKLDLLFEQLEEIVAAGHRALVFSQFTTFLARIADRADREGIGYAYIDGTTRRRAAVIERFKTGDAPMFLISLKAGGFGLNLTEADYVFLMDPWWNPATENQAIDRTHRIGQERTVMVHRMISAGTIEEKVMALKARKAQLFDAVLNDDEGTFAGSLQPDDIRGLLDL